MTIRTIKISQTALISAYILLRDMYPSDPEVTVLADAIRYQSADLALDAAVIQLRTPSGNTPAAKTAVLISAALDHKFEPVCHGITDPDAAHVALKLALSCPEGATAQSDRFAYRRSLLRIDELKMEGLAIRSHPNEYVSKGKKPNAPDPVGVKALMSKPLQQKLQVGQMVLLRRAADNVLIYDGSLRLGQIAQPYNTMLALFMRGHYPEMPATVLRDCGDGVFELKLGVEPKLKPAVQEV